MQRFLAELVRRDRALAIVGACFVALLAIMLLAPAVDDRTVLGLNVWVKPIKFAASIAIYLWTLAWLLGELPGRTHVKTFIRWGSIVAMIVEIACIAGQSLRGTASHFNAATPFDIGVFAVMGLFIGFNTALEALVLALFCQRGLSEKPAYLWGIRFGLIGSLLSAGVGGAMLVHDAHTVGAADGGPGLWLVNWSTRAGDLRVAHAIGLHALQVLPLAGYILSRQAPPRAGTIAMTALSAAYIAIGCWLFLQAVEGQPLWRTAETSPANNASVTNQFAPPASLRKQ